MSTQPFNLVKPTSTFYQGKRCWTPSIEHMVEYGLWTIGKPIMVGHLQQHILAYFRTELSASYLGQIVRALCAQGKAIKLARGLYVHAQVPPDETAAPTLEDLLS